MTHNILFLDNAFWVTELTEWPKKPKHYGNQSPSLPFSEQRKNMAYDEACTHITPIVESDWEKVKQTIFWIGKDTLVNGTIYHDTGIEFEEVSQFRHLDPQWLDWVDTGMRLPECEYRKAYRLKGEQPKAEEHFHDCDCDRCNPKVRSKEESPLADLVQLIWESCKAQRSIPETIKEINQKFHITRKI